MATQLAERLAALLPSSGKLADAARRAIEAAGAPAPGWLGWLATSDGAPLPHAGAPLVPVARAGADWLALDLCAEAIERSRLPVLASPDGRWWRPAAPDLGALLTRPPAAPAEPFERAVKQAPTSFHLHAAEAAVARAAGRSHDEAARLVAALRRPLYTAESLLEIGAVQDRALALEAETSVDPLTLRLARAGLDAEAWRTVGAERAVAGRTGDALRALDGALFLGAPLDAVRPARERLLVRAGWAWMR